MKKIVAILITLSLGITLFGCSNVNAPNPDLSDVATSYELTTGYYTVGTDLPEGMCDLNWLEGTGSFGCYDNMSESVDINKQNQKYLGLELEKGDILMIWDAVKISVTYSAITGGYTGSTEETKNSIIIGPGNYKTGQYEVGKDLKAGTYNIYGEYDWGQVACGDLGFDSTITDEPTNYDTGQVHSIKNITLYKGMVLWVIGCKVKLIPVKANI
jgi:hypothetical protein